MKPYFAGHPAATALFAGTLAVWVIIELRQALKRRPEASKEDHGSRFVIVLCIGGAFILAARASRCHRCRLSRQPYAANRKRIIPFVW